MRSRGSTNRSGPQKASGSRADEIREVAAALFERAGYSPTTVKDVADAAGVLPGSLYHHFDSKESLAVAIVEAFNDDLADVASAALKNRGDATSALEDMRAFVRTVTTLSLRHAAAVRIRAHEAPSVATERMRDAVRYIPRAYEKAWRRAVVNLSRELAERPVDHGLLRFTLQTATLEAAFSFDSSNDPDALGDLLCDTLFGGLAMDAPDDVDLDNSTARKVAAEMTATWVSAAPSTRSGDRAAILHAARTEFARRGFDATTIRDIANAASVGMATLYRQVDSKQQLLEEILQDFSDRIGQCVRAVLTAEGSEPELLDAAAVVLVRAKRRFREESEILKLGWFGQTPSGATARGQPFHAYFVQTQDRLHLLEDVLARRMRTGTLRPVGHTSLLAPLLREIWWLPFQDFARSSEARTHRFLRSTVIRGVIGQ